jgi:protein-S-isoprenylcysteine O-methyltransferase Ste14
MDTPKQQQTYHEILARSYLVYFIFSIIALFIDSRMPIRFDGGWLWPLAIICFAVGPLLILWAQLTSAKSVDGKQSHPYFGKGPYRYLRNPTQLGILILITGYVLVSASLVFFAVSVIAYFVSNQYFKKYELALKKEYGQHYEAYEKDVQKVL